MTLELLSMDHVRAFAKKLLRKNPFLLGLVQGCYLKLKRAGDRVVFKLRNPAADWIFPTDADLDDARRLGSFSQYRQDLFVHDLLRRLGKEGAGFFVDVGANHPTNLSNSLYFECQGWSGIAIDPLKRFVGLWKERVDTQFYSAAVSKVEGAYAFIEITSVEGWEHTLSGFKGCVRQGDMALYGYEEYEVEARPLRFFLGDRQEVDLLLIDVEGAEVEVLGAVDFERYSPRIVMVENVSAIGGGLTVRRMMSDAGYTLVARLGAADDVYVRK